MSAVNDHHSVDLLTNHWLPVRGRVDYKIAILYCKAVICNNFRILLVYSRHRDSRVSQSSSTNIAARRFSCCASTVWNSLPSFVRTADSKVLSLSSRLTYSRDICSRSTVRASDTLTGSFARYTFVTSLLSLNCRLHAPVQQEMVLGR